MIPAGAQNADTTSTVMGRKLDFEQPRFIISDYLEGIKRHLSAEGRKEWKPEFSLRANVRLLDESLYLTGGIRTSQNKVFGIGAGWGRTFYRFGPVPKGPTGQYISFFLHHRHYIPLGHRQRFFLYSDLMAGGSCVCRMSDWYMENGYVRTPEVGPEWPVLPGDCRWWITWQPGISIRLWGKSNLFLGPSFGPTVGAHLGIAL